MKLLIDAGNQRIKWATSQQLRSQPVQSTEECPQNKCLQNEPIETGSADLFQALERAFTGLPDPDGILISSVARPDVNQILSEACTSFWGSPPIFMKSRKHGKGLSNRYDKPEDLGVDRWLTMIGAKLMTGNQPMVVIDAGTAVTIDYVNAQCVFDGGIIFPGMATMIYSLHSSTGQIRPVTANTMKGCLSYQNSNTWAAVENGVMLAVVSAMDCAICHYKKIAGLELRLILTGGDAHRLAAVSEHQFVIVPDLVLIGLLALSEEDA